MKNDSPYRVVGGRVKRRVRMIAVTNNPLEVIDRRTGEVKMATPYVGSRAWRDIEDFVKLYDTSSLMGLRLCEWRVLLCVMEDLDFDGLFVYNEEECVRRTGMTGRMVYRGLKGLVDRDIVRRSKRGVYWVNPNIVYKGSRDELLEI